MLFLERRDSVKSLIFSINAIQSLFCRVSIELRMRRVIDWYTNASLYTSNYYVVSAFSIAPPPVSLDTRASSSLALSRSFYRQGMTEITYAFVWVTYFKLFSLSLLFQHSFMLLIIFLSEAAKRYWHLFFLLIASFPRRYEIVRL